jgi:arylsulfatase A-like enzyme
MTPRSLLRVTFALLFVLGVCEVHAQSEPSPKYVVIFADDLGYGDLECYGHPQFKTPNLNRMAAEGVRLTQFYVPTPYCAPSRGTLLTGRYPWRHGVWRNPSPDANINDVGIPETEVTLAEALKQAGYATACIGKWHLGHKAEFHPLRHGFDEYLGILYSNDMRPVQLLDGPNVVEYPVVQATLTQRYTARALDFLELNAERPFLLYLPHAMPHKPLAASEAYYQRSGAGLYGDVIAELDASVGLILDKLKSLGLDERTLVVFASDNGAWLGGSTGGLRGMKGQTWEGGLRVPGIFRWPGHLPAGRVVTEPCGTIDVFPTLLKLAGVPVPDDRVIDGRDLLPVLTGGGSYADRPLFGMQGDQLMTIRVGRFKLHARPPQQQRWIVEGDAWVDPRAPDGVTLLAPFEQARPSAFPGVQTGDPPTPLMLFDLERDPSEQHNVAAQYPDVVGRLRVAFQQMQSEFDAEMKRATGRK